MTRCCTAPLATLPPLPSWPCLILYVVPILSPLCQSPQSPPPQSIYQQDDTLVKVKSGKKWPTAPTDYEAWHPSAVVSKLKELVSDGYKLVIFTNQKGISSERDKSKRTGGPKERTILGRLEGFIDGVCLFTICFFSISKNKIK